MTASSGKRSKVSDQPERRSHSRSRSHSTLRHSRRSYRSRSNKRRSSSRSSRESRSYTRSRDRSYSRSRSRSGSRFRSYSRSRSGSQSGRSITRSRSDSRSRSRYRTRSRTRSRSRYRSQSPYYRKRNESKHPEGNTQKVKNSVLPTAQAVEPKAPPSAAVENVPVLPLSDSPPPSRWKPGQKPWKPSYVRIQEIKVKKDSPSQVLVSRSSGMPLERQPLSSAQNQLEKPSSHKVLSSSSQYSGKTKKPENLLRRGSSRTRSSSRSRSRSCSSYHSMSPGQYSRSSSSSSSSRSASYYSYRRTSSERRVKSHSSHRKDHKTNKNVIPVKEDASPSRSDDGTDSKHSILGVQEDPIDPVPNFHIKAENNASVVTANNPKPGSGWESDNEHLSKLASAYESKPPQISVKEDSVFSEKKKITILARCWDSESESEMPEANNVSNQNKPSSEKEEGEASSESESEEPSRLSNKPDQLSKVLVESRNHEHSDDYIKTEKHKSKKAKRKHKHKRKHSDRSGSHRVKMKTKRSKKKHPKPKETFHWQPPLEFGDEVEEDDSLAQAKNIDPTQQSAHSERLQVKSTQLKSDYVESKDYSKIINDSSKEGCSTAEISKSGDVSATVTKRQLLKLNVETEKGPAQSRHPDTPGSQSSVNQTHAQDQTKGQDDMEICTPEHNGVTKTESPDPCKNGNQRLLPQTDQKTSGSSPSLLTPANQAGEPTPSGAGLPIDPKWKPLKGMTVVPTFSAAPLTMKMNRLQDQGEGKTPGLKIEIKSKNRVRPGSLFDEVRKTARLNQRPRNQDSSSEEGSPAVTGDQAGSQKRSRSKSRSASRRKDRSRSYTHSVSRSRSSSYSSRYIHLTDSIFTIHNTVMSY